MVLANLRALMPKTRSAAPKAAPASPLPALDQRDRFVGFAFAAADLLAELRSDRRVAFAAGAYRERFGRDGEAFIGEPFATLIAPEDGAGLEIALCLLENRGRLPPVTLRLANAARTPMAVSGLRLPHHAGVTWLTLARMPAATAEAHALAAAPLLRSAMAARAQSAEPFGVGLVEVGGWQQLPTQARRSLETDIAAALREAGGSGAMAGELAEGKFGVVGQSDIDIKELQARISRIMHAGGGGRTVAGTRLDPGITQGAGGVATPDAMRAMRFALTCFSKGGTAALRNAGFAGGLRGFLDHTEARAAATRSLLQRGNFRVVYQPVVRLSDRSLHHYEALLRPHPMIGHETVNTEEFVAFAEAAGLADTLDRAVLQRVVETLPKATARVAVNISGISMQSPEFREWLLDIITRNSASCRQLMVELTETADIEDVPAAVDTVNQLVAAGVPVCLDDFGAGFSAFRYLKEFAVAFVKIDGAYVRGASDGARESGFVSAMVELARCVGASAIAEKVETEAEAIGMAALGVQFGQGWLFGRPGALPGTI
jgi:EAL domain-containing protein (putative c-di-GMP-specific phosphodiesterase class I)